MNKILKAIVYILILTFLYLWLTTVFDSCGKKSTEISEDVEEVMDDQDGDDDEEISNDLTEPIEETSSTPVAAPVSEPRFSADNSAPYLIVAGSFSQENNANNLIDKLRRMGYNDAEKVRFDESSFYSVVAERHSNRERANTRARDLKSRGVDCYVHTRK